MWHASISFGRPSSRNDRRRSPAIAERALQGVGARGLGEWREEGDKAYHLRRRLSDEEADEVGPVIDIRGTDEAKQRLVGVAHMLPWGWSE